MKNYLILISLTISNFMFGQSDVSNQMSSLLDSVILKTKEISLYSESVNWKELSNKMHLSAINANNIDELRPAFEILLNTLRDHHGTIRKISDYSIIGNFTDHNNSRKKDQRIYNSEIWEIVNNVNARFEFITLPNNIGYLKIVGIGPNVDGQKEAERIRNVIDTLNTNHINRWIIDLRYNGGGNINVMLAGLVPLLNTKTPVSIVDKNGAFPIKAEIKNGNFWYGGINAFHLENNPIINNPKIAILTSRWTSSSGEFVAVAFKGQSNTKFFGEETGGFTTNNSWEIINNEIALVISTGTYCDRNGTEYKHCVKPDVEVPFEVESDQTKDLGIIEAINWLIK